MDLPCDIEQILTARLPELQRCWEQRLSTGW